MQNINGNQILQVPEWKYTAWTQLLLSADRRFENGALRQLQLDRRGLLLAVRIGEEKAESYGRLDLRATWTSPEGHWVATGFVNNVLDDVGKLQVLRNGEDEFFRQSAGTTVPRLYGLELTYFMRGQ